MSSKSDTEVLIGGKVYTLSGYEGEEYLQRVAVYINNKINEFNQMEEVRRFPVDMKATLVELNIADDFFKAKERIEKLEQDLEIKEKEIYDLKHELISEQIKAETNEKAAKELEEKNKELRLENARLESDIEDLLSDDGSDKEALQTAEASITGDK
ncbi:MAG: cell division protein ZapA [Eubacterium sp.]|nr:cell division protein ZapA [Eubacterium sp.]